MIENQNYQKELKNVTKGAGITALGLIFLNIMAFVNNAIITRTLGAESYGLYVLATRILEFLSVVGIFGFQATIVKYISAYNGSKNYSYLKGTMVYCQKYPVIFSVILSLTIVILSDYISKDIFDKPNLSFYLKILILILPLNVFISISSSSLQGLKQIKLQVLIEKFGIPTIFLLLLLLTSLLNNKLTGVFIAHILNIIIISSIFFYFIRKKVFTPLRKEDARHNSKEIWNFSTPLYLNSFIGTAIRQSPIFIMGYYLANSEIAVYNIGFKLAVLSSFSIKSFSLIFLPTISELFSKGERKILNSLNKTITKWILTISLLIASILILYNKPILEIFGDEFSEGTLILLLIISGELINSAAGMTSGIILMSGRPKIILFNNMISLCLMISISIWLTPIYGNIGPAIAYIVSAAFINTIKLIQLYLFEKIHPFSADYFKPVASALICFGIIYYLNSTIALNNYMLLILGSTIFSALYFGLLKILILSDDDLYIISLIKDKLIYSKNFTKQK